MVAKGLWANMSVYDDVMNNFDVLCNEPTTRDFIEESFNRMTAFIDDSMLGRVIYGIQMHRNFDLVYADCKHMTNRQVVRYFNQWRMDIELYISK